MCVILLIWLVCWLFTYLFSKLPKVNLLLQMNITISIYSSVSGANASCNILMGLDNSIGECFYFFHVGKF